MRRIRYTLVALAAALVMGLAACGENLPDTAAEACQGHGGVKFQQGDEAFCNDGLEVERGDNGWTEDD